MRNNSEAMMTVGLLHDANMEIIAVKRIWGREKERICIQTKNALLKPKCCIQEKPWIVSSPASLQAEQSPLDPHCVFMFVWNEMKCKIWELC